MNPPLLKKLHTPLFLHTYQKKMCCVAFLGNSILCGLIKLKFLKVVSLLSKKPQCDFLSIKKLATETLFIVSHLLLSFFFED